MRRRLMLLAALAALPILSACSNATAPSPNVVSHDDCKSGYWTSDGKFVCTDPG